MNKKPTLVTRLAHAGFTDHRLRGRSLFREVVGRGTPLQVAIFALCGKWIEGVDLLLMQDLGSILVVADPRIWPDKITRLVSSYGSSVPAFAAGEIMQNGSRIGFRVGSACARMLMELQRHLEEGGESDPASESDRVGDFLRRKIAAQRGVVGFGVPFRDRDERLARLRECVHERKTQERRYWRLVELIIGLAERGEIPAPNIVFGAAAVELEAGLTPEEMDDVTIYLGQIALRANAVEGAAQAPEILRTLPEQFLKYLGPAPRRSERAQRQDQQQLEAASGASS